MNDVHRMVTFVGWDRGGAVLQIVRLHIAIILLPDAFSIRERKQLKGKIFGAILWTRVFRTAEYPWKSSA